MKEKKVGILKFFLKKIDVVFNGYLSALFYLSKDILFKRHECNNISLGVFFDLDTYWLYKNKGERMDANNCLCGLESRRLFHKDRYEFAAKELKTLGCNGGILVDSACGTGYGTRILSDFLDTKVSGLDIDPRAVVYANNKYSSKNTSFSSGDLLKEESFKASSIDYFVSFETIEHVPEPIKILENISKWLKRDGVLIISTPNKWGLTPFHFFDYDYESFMEHLSMFFKVESMYSQNSGTDNFPTNHGMPRQIVVSDKGNIETAEILIAVCRQI